MAPGKLCQGTDVVRLHDPARRAFHVEQPGARQRLIDRHLVAAIDIGHVDLHPFEDCPEQTKGVGIDMAHSDDAVTGGDDTQDRGGNGGHAAGKAQSVLGAFQLCQHLLEGAHRRIEAARIDRPDDVSAIGRDHLIVVAEGEQRCLGNPP